MSHLKISTSKFIFLFIVIHFVLSVSSIWISLRWVLFLQLWAGLCLFTYHKLQQVKSKNILLFYITALLYPVGETFLQYLISRSFTNPNFQLINRAEHLLWGFAFAIMIFLLCKIYFRFRKKYFLFFIIFSLVNTIGTFNELIEFVVRELSDLSKVSYYEDTMYDFSMNIVGSSIGIVAGFLYNKYIKSSK